LKKRGFITLECIISMFILSIIVYMITFSINNSFNLLNKNKEYSTMLNLAQNYMNETKNDIKYKNDKINTETIYLNKFQINKIITKKENYYNCYKLRLEVKSQDRSVNLESYVTKK
jgi:type II secretory pathway pseudopilin PulG